jgi:hypothetical protein
MNIARTLVAALAVAALLTPTAVARPIDTPTPAPAVKTDDRPVMDMRQSVAEHLAAQREKRESALPGPPAMPMDPQPIDQPAAATTPDDGIDWATIGIGVGLTFVALGAITFATHRIRDRQQRPRIAA